LRWTDERLGQGLKALDPAQSATDASPTSADWARLRTMMAADGTPVRPTLVSRFRGLWLLPIGATAIALVLVLAVGIGSLTTPPAYAGTPPPLVPTPIAESVTTLIDESMQTLLAAPQPAARREGQLVRWQNGQDATDAPVIVPERYVWAHDENGVGSLKVTAEPPYSVRADGQITSPVGPAPTAGAPSAQRAEDTYFGAFPTEPPADPAGLAAALRENVSMRDDPDAIDYWGAFQALLGDWTLTPAHHAGMLQILQDSGGMELLGTATDRLGRAGIALRLTSPVRTAFSVTIILDVNTRQIIAADVIYAGGLDIVDEPAGSVVEYSAWPSPSD
jgi:hypothetical protein